ncbi:MAG TPA: hypothetical protein VFC19_11465 [Candidatus Limnocylindrales bacterium]|nr:hypothetical protein [Candidatus Limnocylindrales bacterium]
MSRRFLDWTARLSAVIVLVGAAAVALSGASAASPAAVAALPPYCPTVSGTGAVVCATTGSGSLASAFSSPTIAATPAGCGNGSWLVRDRMVSCQHAYFILEKFSLPDRVRIGYIVFTVLSAVTTLGANGPYWNHTFQYNAQVSVGQVYTSELRTAPECYAACSYASTVNPPSGPATGVHSGVQVYQTSGAIGTRWTARSDWAMTFYDPTTINKFTQPLRLGYPGHRCDDALPGSGPGCVQSSFRPHLALDKPNYPNYREHIRIAQMPVGGPQPNLLNRTTNVALMAANRNVSCPPSSPTYPRPPGYECDEYPFASTYQGAAGLVGEGFNLKVSNRITNIDCRVTWLPTQAQTPHRGFSPCMIPADENSLGGGELGEFYRKNRIIDGDPFTVLRP